MPQETEFQWRPRSSPRSKLAAGVIVGVIGLVTGFLFVEAGRHTGADDPTAGVSVAAVSPPAPVAFEEPSSVAEAAPQVHILNPSNGRSAELTRDEPSADAIEAPVADPRSIERASTEPKDTAANYARLRQALLRNIR